MGTHSEAYTDNEYPSTYKPTKINKDVYTVLKVVSVEIYHYHGSWFKYEYDLDLLDAGGKVLKMKIDSWNEYEDLLGKVIEYDGNVFTVHS
ncbi:hypothetical protein ABHN03_25325 [Paenibacillus sp. NRS-1775]|uniref:hypothetical protein n=1 Tax=unclassified Paenibacillus TaxID=185978 RepID=UPI003D26EB56